MRNGIRLFVAPWYLLGWLSHVYLGLSAPEETYGHLAETALLPAYTTLWRDLVMPNITFFALLLAAFEIVVGVLLVGKGKRVKVGLILSIMFCLFLLQMGMGVLTTSRWESFVSNRLPPLAFLALQVPLLWGHYETSLPEAIWIRLPWAVK